MDFATSKNLSGIGAILTFLSFMSMPFAAPFGCGALTIIGLAMMLIGVNGLSDYFEEKAIFSNALHGTLAIGAGVVATIAVMIGILINSLMGFLQKLFPGWNGDWMALSGMTPNISGITFSDVIPFIWASITAFLILFAVSVLSAVLFRRSLGRLKAKSGVGLFGTTGTLLLIGAILTVFMIGYVIIWLSILLLALAFFELKESNPQAVQIAPLKLP